MPTTPCPYCGNNPVPHLTNWYFESINVLFTPIRQFLFYNPLAEKMGDMAQNWDLGLKAMGWLRALKIVSSQSDIRACKVGRAEVLWEEAQKRGIHMSELLLFGRPFDAYLAEKNGRAILFSGLPRPKNYNKSALEKMDDKIELKRRLKEINLPVPQGGIALTFGQAKKIFNRINKPVIVKPREGSRGRHSTTHVYSIEQLKKAFKVAKQLCLWVIVEEHLKGPVYRGTVIDYKAVGVLRGDAPQVVGDGIHTIAELVAAKNAAPHPRVADIKLDDRAKTFLSRCLPGIDEKAPDPFFFVPATGEIVETSEKIGLSYGGSSSEDYDICHPDNIKMFEEAAKIMGDPIVGFDFIVEDITQSYKQQRCGFIEANSLPFIDLHHHPLLGQPRNAAAAVWDLAGFT
jgi:D-alanine-D-alanine ligase-like ATP-grasp enzyme